MRVWRAGPENATYDELGRVTTRQIGSAANTQTQHFDGLGRLDVLTNPLGSFTMYSRLRGSMDADRDPATFAF